MNLLCSDVLKLIADYINPPLFKMQDWNTFARLCKKTNKIAQLYKIQKGKIFNVDICKFETEQTIKYAKLELKLAKAQYESDLLYKMNRRTYSGILLRMKINKLKKVFDGKKTHAEICICAEGKSHDKLNMLILSLFSSFINPPLNFTRDSSIHEIGEQLHKSLKNHQNQTYRQCCVIIECCTDGLDMSKHCISIFVYNEKLYREKILQKIIDNAKKGKICNINHIGFSDMLSYIHILPTIVICKIK